MAPMRLLHGKVKVRGWGKEGVVFLSCLLTADPKKCDLPLAQAGSHFEGSAAWAGARKMDESAARLQTPESI